MEEVRLTTHHPTAALRHDPFLCHSSLSHVHALAGIVYNHVKIDEVYDIADRRSSSEYVIVAGRRGLGGTEHRGRQRYESTSAILIDI